MEKRRVELSGQSLSPTLQGCRGEVGIVNTLLQLFVQSGVAFFFTYLYLLLLSLAFNVLNVKSGRIALLRALPR